MRCPMPYPQASRNAMPRRIGRSRNVRSTWRGFCCCSIAILGWSEDLSLAWRSGRRVLRRCCAYILQSRFGRTLRGMSWQGAGGPRRDRLEYAKRNVTALAPQDETQGCPMLQALFEKEDYEDCQCRPCPAAVPFSPAGDLRSTRAALAGEAGQPGAAFAISSSRGRGDALFCAAAGRL